MKRSFFLSASVLLLGILAACSTVTTSADYDDKANFSSYKTWGWRDDGSIKDELVAKRVQSAVATQLAAKGLTRNDANPDLWVAVHGRMSKQTQITQYNSGWGYGWGWYGHGAGGGISTATVQEIPVGTIVVDLADAKRKELVWRGTASDTLNPERSPQEKEKALNEALAKMFEKYPPPGK
ncbi:MAG TPA: DUF4136 domain-containing protein [Thermoanaerobaculia bacterium]